MQRDEVAGEGDGGERGHQGADAAPAGSVVAADPDPGARAAAQVRAGQVGGVEPAAGVGAQGEHPGLVGDHAGPHGDVEHQGAEYQGGRSRSA
ncbi:hypothetical protein [Embleya sp. NPDC050493]|uniref:hypothetical protein n=1 Tax=Embleya sp. NPDC050493 TaxID=3363989 RepID=UPI0037A730DD